MIETNENENNGERNFCVCLYLGFVKFPENFLSILEHFYPKEAVKEIRRERDAREEEEEGDKRETL